MALKKFALDVAALTAARVLQAVSGFLAIPILARLLSPAEFGLIAMASTFVLFTSAISDVGLGQTLVRVDRREQDVWSSAFWFVSLIGLILSGFLVLIAWPSSWLMEEPRLIPIILTLAPLPLMQAATAPFFADLQQREQFRLLALTEFISAITGIGVAITLALNDAGVWALVAQQLTVWVLKAVLVTMWTTFRPNFVFRLSLLGPHIMFSRDTGILGVVTFLSRQLDPLVIGRSLGAASVGLYSVAGRIANLPMQFLSAPLQSALFTRMVILREDRRATGDLILVASWIVGAVVFPGMAVAAAASGAYFHVFLTEKWSDAAPIFSALAPVLSLQTVMAVCGTMLLAAGATGLRLRLAVEFLVAWLVVLPIAAQFDVLTVAVSYTLIYFLFAIRRYPIYLDTVGCTVAEFVRTMSPPTLVACAAAGAQFGLSAALRLTDIMQIALSLVILAAAYGTLALIERKHLGARIEIMRQTLRARTNADDIAPQPA